MYRLKPATLSPSAAPVHAAQVTGVNIKNIDKTSDIPGECSTQFDRMRGGGEGGAQGAQRPQGPQVPDESSAMYCTTFKHTPLNVDRMLPQLNIVGLDEETPHTCRTAKTRAASTPSNLFKTMIGYVESKLAESSESSVSARVEPEPDLNQKSDRIAAVDISKSTGSQYHTGPSTLTGKPADEQTLTVPDSQDDKKEASQFEQLAKLSRLHSAEGREARLELLRLATIRITGNADALQRSAAEEIRRICVRIGRKASKDFDFEFQERLFTEIPSFIVDVGNDDLVRRSLTEALSTIAHRAPTLKKFTAVVLSNTLYSQSTKNKSAMQFETRLLELLESFVRD